MKYFLQKSKISGSVHPLNPLHKHQRLFNVSYKAIIILKKHEIKKFACKHCTINVYYTLLETLKEALFHGSLIVILCHTCYNLYLIFVQG